MSSLSSLMAGRSSAKWILLGLTSPLLSACNLDCLMGSGELISEERTTEAFDTVILENAATLILTQGESGDGPNIRIEAEDNILPLVRTTVSNGVLTIDSDRCLNPHQNITLYLTMASVKKLEVDGSGDISATTTLTSPSLELSVPGSGTMNLGLDVDALQLHIDGSGTLNLTGTAPDLNAQIDGSGLIDAFGVAAQRVIAGIDGSGDIKVTASESLNVTIDGSGTVYYKGNPTVQSHIGGSGEVVNAN